VPAAIDCNAAGIDELPISTDFAANGAAQAKAACACHGR
jgi:hypothetical protein